MSQPKELPEQEQAQEQAPQKSRLSSFQLRVLSSCLIVPVFALSIYLGGVVFFVFISVLLFISFDELSKMSRKSTSKTKDCVLGAVYLCFGLGAFLLMRILPSDGASITLALLFMIWACDTGAYFAGKTIGRTKLCPSISPGKTWEGLIGGVLLSMVVAYVAHNFFGLYVSVAAALFIGALVALAGQAGDLMISKYKRHVDVKDTGTIIPGHGGVLDRIDSLLFAAPIYFVCIALLHEAMS